MQGVFPPGTLTELGLPAEWWGAVEWQYPPEERLGAYEEEGRAINHLKAGITTADRWARRRLCCMAGGALCTSLM